MLQIRNILEKIYNNKVLRKTIVPLFIGPTGLGKSKIIKKFAKDKNVHLEDFITSQRNPFEISGMAIPDRDIKKMSFWDFDTLLKLKDGDILFFDEVFNGNPTVLNACLTILEERTMISGKKLPDIMIVAAANFQGMAPLTPQIKERFVWYNVKFSRKMWKDYMFSKYKMVNVVSNKLCELIENEEFNGWNFYTPRSIDKITNMIINEVPIPKDYENIPLILDTMIENNIGDIEENGIKLKQNEKIGWLTLIKKLQYEIIKK